MNRTSTGVVEPLVERLLALVIAWRSVQLVVAATRARVPGHVDRDNVREITPVHHRRGGTTGRIHHGRFLILHGRASIVDAVHPHPGV